eukprot:CAMPEP_0115069616 /NCGR_PEP_ID=MMETSP0227-20121206/12663_1 /TAXON_ID=89957 /ORGANISM="Polarella glacialis, Strain CCMP 1383" /LENGTH=131 /DNA_ID=CAMNT_0002456051 /DNA_START=536 /DNA_END=931 /DNA_ORIENTATION=-
MSRALRGGAIPKVEVVREASFGQVVRTFPTETGLCSPTSDPRLCAQPPGLPRTAPPGNTMAVSTPPAPGPRAVNGFRCPGSLGVRSPRVKSSCARGIDDSRSFMALMAAAVRRLVAEPHSPLTESSRTAWI